MDHRDRLFRHLIRTSQTDNRETTSELKLVTVIGVTAVFLISGLNASAEVVPRLTVGQYYNDNVSLAPAGMEQYAHITEIEPGVNLFHDGRSVDAQFDYMLRVLYFSGAHDKDEVYHQASAQSEMILVPQSLFLDASATYSQLFISPDGVIDLDNLSSPENTTGVLTYRLSPYVRQQYGNLANAEYRIQQENVQYDENVSAVQSDSTSTLSTIDISSGLAFDELHWQLLLSHNKLKADNAPDSKLQSALVSTRYELGPKFEFLADAGYEDNDYQQANNLTDPSGAIWNIGLGWNPGRRTHLEVRVGERFFGKTSSFLFNHRTRRSTWNVEYVEELTTTPQLQQITSINLPNAEGEIVPVPLESPYIVRTSSVILMERLTLSSRIETGKSIINLSLYSDKRQYQDLGQDEDSLGASASWDWRFQPRTTVRLSWTWYEIEYLGSDRLDHLSQSELGLERQLSRSMVGALSYRLLDRNSSDNANEYERQLVSVTVAMEF